MLYARFPASKRFVAAVSGRTHNKDSFAAQKTLSFNDFSHFPNAPWHAIWPPVHATARRHRVSHAFAYRENPHEY